MITPNFTPWCLFWACFEQISQKKASWPHASITPTQQALRRVEKLFSFFLIKPLFLCEECLEKAACFLAFTRDPLYCLLSASNWWGLGLGLKQKDGKLWFLVWNRLLCRLEIHGYSFRLRFLSPSVLYPSERYELVHRFPLVVPCDWKWNFNTLLLLFHNPWTAAVNLLSKT